MTKVNKDILKTTYRISDHYNSKVKTKVVKRATNFNFITRKINNMIKQVRTMRYYKLVENVCQNNEQE
ncbi:MAG: hypothetical protein EOM19_02075 [Candidatus Moranbacteria bacterium]|nr:hypothetical protein [Candidatus Moranbacteria bacterium]